MNPIRKWTRTTHAGVRFVSDFKCSLAGFDGRELLSDAMRIVNVLSLGLLALVVSQVSMSNPVGPVVPGAMTVVEGKVSQWPLPLKQTPRDPVTAADGNVYFSVAGAHRIGRFDPRSGQFSEWSLPEGTRPHGLAVARDGKLFFAGNGTGTLGELDTLTGKLRVYPTSSSESRPYTVAIGPDGHVWMTMRAAGRLAMLDRASGKVSEIPMDGDPYGLAFDQRGVLWVTRIGVDKLSSVDPRDGRTTDLVLSSGSKPRRIVLAPDGMLWVSLYGTGKLVKIHPETNRVVREFDVPGGANAGPYSVNVDARGRVWVAQFQADSIAILDVHSDKFRVIRLPDRNTGVRNATLDAQGRYWYIGTTTGNLGVIE